MSEQPLMFKIMDKIKEGDMSFIDSFSDEELKEFSPYMTMKWLSSVSDNESIIKLNDLVNSVVFENTDKRYMYKLLALSMTTANRNQRVKWLYKKKSKVSNAIVEVIALYYKVTYRTAKESYDMYDKETIVHMAEELGYTPEELKKVKNEFKNR